MAARHLNYNQPYVNGSNAVAYDRLPDAPDVSGEAHEEGISLGYKVSINPLYTLLLMSLVFMMLMICVMMLKAQFTVASTSEQVIGLKRELTAVRRENAHLESIIHEELDLVEIKRVAMEEYGMVYPTDSEVLSINSQPSSYTVQLAPIEAAAPENTSIGNILAFITRGW